VLSNPELVKAIEGQFVPLAIQNNTGGTDAKILGKYGEPSWNNPVVRFIDATGKDIIERKGGVYHPSAVKARMQDALKAFNANQS